MMESICTIPLTEVLEERDGCPLCRIRDTLERRVVEYITGPAMMEPDHRILSNTKGYCRRHMDQLAGAKRALPFALVLDTRMDEVAFKDFEYYRTKNIPARGSYLKEEDLAGEQITLI